MNQLKQLIGVHFKEFFREPGIIFWAILFPILMALGLGMAFSGDGEQIRNVAVVGLPQDNLLKLSDSSPSKEWSKKIGSEKLGFTNYRFKNVSWDEAIAMLQQGKTSLVINNDGGNIKFHFDPANAEAKLTYLQLSSILNNEKHNESFEEVAVLKQKGTRYVDFLVPGLMAMGIMMNCMWGISYANVDKRNKKLLRRMVATPMKKSNFVLAQFISRIFLSAIEAALLILFCMWIFDIKITGSLPALIIMFLAGNFAFTGIAMLISSRTDNTQIANGLINLVILPMMILSGIYFSYHNFPDFMISVIQILPLTILADEVRSIFLESSGILDIIPAAMILTAVGFISFVVGIRIYKWY